MKAKLFVLCCIVVSLLGCKEIQINENTALFDAQGVQENVEIETDVKNHKGEDIYYVAPYGKKYHYSDCFYVRAKLKNCTPYTADEATKYGYEACSRCVDR